MTASDVGHIHSAPSRSKPDGKLSFHLEELASLKRSPFSDEPVVCFSAGADVGAMLELGLERPKVVRDLSPAFNLYANGVLPGGKGTRSLAAACARFGIRHASILEKDALQQRCAKGPPFTLEESQRIPHYCMDDVCATAGLYGKLWPTDDIEQWRAELRSRYTSCLAEVYRLGTPIDLPLYCEIVENLPAITRGLMNRDAINREIYADGTFNMRRFAEALRDRGIVRWPLTETTRALRTDRRTLETMVLRHPELAPFRDLKSLLDVLDEQAITVGPSGRNRCFQGPFIAKTGRDAPRGRIWNLATWWFNLVRPEPGTSLIHADYKAQEFGTLAVLSGDPVMLDEYPRDPFTIRAKAANLPRGAVKTATFAKFYGAGFDRLAEVLGRGNVPAFESSMSVYRRAWQWLARRTLRARIEHKIETYYGWRLAVSSATKATTLMNYPIQGNAGEITRLALIYAVEAGLRICAVIHDALVAECERGKEAEQSRCFGT